jgi:hypothetical protein
MASQNFFAELKRPSVYKVAVACAVVGRLLIRDRDPSIPILRNSELGCAPGRARDHHRLL